MIESTKPMRSGEAAMCLCTSQKHERSIASALISDVKLLSVEYENFSHLQPAWIGRS